MATICKYVQEDFESQVTWDIRGIDELYPQIKKLVEGPLP